MTLPETADAINLTAADWAARADRGLSEAEAADLAAWLAGDPRRAGAYMRMTAVLAGTEARTTAPVDAQDLNRRQWLVAGGALAASIVGGGVWFGLNRPAVYETRKGEKRVVALRDGSTITLNTATRVEVRYSKAQRRLRLVSGEALFDVAKDASRPFVVRAGAVSVRAVGTSFTVASGAREPVKVLVREGVVEVARSGASRTQAMRLAANTRALIEDAAVPPVIARVESTEVNRELAWREGRLVFAGESLSQAAAQFARYSDTRIVVTDPVLAGSGVAGVFDANDPVGFAQAVAGSLDARAEVREGQVLVTR